MLFPAREESKEVPVAFGRILELCIKNSVPSFTSSLLKERVWSLLWHRGFCKVLNVFLLFTLN